MAYSDLGRVTVTKIRNGERVEIVRGDGCRAKFDVYPDHIHWVSLTSPGGRGWTKTVHEWGAKEWPGKYVLASAAKPDSEAVLKRHGNWQGSRMSMRLDL